MKTFVISYLVWLALAAGCIAVWRTRPDAAPVDSAKRPVPVALSAPSPPLEQRLRSALAATTALHQIPDAVFQLLDGADQASIVEAAASFKNRKDGVVSNAALHGLLSRWFELDREAAFSFILEMDAEPLQRATEAAKLLSNWADSDSAACLRWAKGPGAQLVEAAFGNHETLAERDHRLFALLEPDECMKKAAAPGKKDGPESKELTRAMARWRVDPASRQAFLDELKQRDLSGAPAFSYWSAIDVSGLQAMLSQPPANDTDWSYTAVMWAAMNTGPGPAGPAATWLRDLSTTTKGRQGILYQIVNSWMSTGKEGLDSWIAAQPDPADRDTLGRAAALQSMEVDSETAVRWADRISDPVLRLQTLHFVIREWQRDDPLAAAAFVSGAPWPEESKNTLALMCLCPSETPIWLR